VTEELQSTIRKRLEALQDEEYKKFTAALIPGIDRDKTLGVRVPALRKLAAGLLRDNESDLPRYFEMLGPDSFYEEKQLWGILLGKAKLDDSMRMAHYRNFVPVIDNWAVCDIACGTLAAAKKNPDIWMDFFLSYVERQEEFEIRFGVVMLLANFIDEDHIDQVLDALAKVDHPAYYVTMAVGWTLAACYVRFPDKAEHLLASGVLTKEIQNKAIQKIRESNSVSKSDKERMKGYKKT
jgi:3-methyladenine DNA glycosylase AlkD